MYAYFQRILYFASSFFAIATCIPTSQMFTMNGNNQRHLVSHAITVCLNTVKQSGPSSLYITDFNADPSIPLLIQTLHNLSIPTIFMTHLRKLLNLSGKNQMNNYMFFLDDVNAIFDLILSFASKDEKNGEIFFHHEVKHEENLHNYSIPIVNSQKKSDFHYIENLPRYCIIVDGYSQSTANKICDEKMFISSKELNGSATLSNVNLKNPWSVH